MKILVTAAEEQELRRAERAFDMVKKSKDVKAASDKEVDDVLGKLGF